MKMPKSLADTRNDLVDDISTISDVVGGRIVIAGLMLMIRDLTDKLAAVDERLFWLMMAQASTFEECRDRVHRIRCDLLIDFTRRGV